MILPPCKNCEQRALGCHDKCKKYKAYKLKLEKEKAYNAHFPQTQTYLNAKFRKER